MREILKIRAAGDRLIVEREGLTTDLGAQDGVLGRLANVARGLLDADERQLLEKVLGLGVGVAEITVREGRKDDQEE